MLYDLYFLQVIYSKVESQSQHYPLALEKVYFPYVFKHLSKNIWFILSHYKIWHILYFLGTCISERRNEDFYFCEKENKFIFWIMDLWGCKQFETWGEKNLCGTIAERSRWDWRRAIRALAQDCRATLRFQWNCRPQIFPIRIDSNVVFWVVGWQ